MEWWHPMSAEQKPVNLPLAGCFIVMTFFLLGFIIGIFLGGM